MASCSIFRVVSDPLKIELFLYRQSMAASDGRQFRQDSGWAGLEHYVPVQFIEPSCF